MICACMIIVTCLKYLVIHLYVYKYMCIYIHIYIILSIDTFKEFSRRNFIPQELKDLYLEF